MLIVSDYRKEIWPEISNIIVDTISNEKELLSIHVMPEEVFNQTRNQSFLTNVFNHGIILYENKN